MIFTLGYIGPGAGFAFVGSFLVLIAALALARVSLLSWPFRVVARILFGGWKRKRTPVRRVVIVGLDGFDPAHYRRLADAGLLPNLEKLEVDGAFSELLSSCPPISPVAWSSFMTGCNPGKHNIFDFLGRDTRTYLPELSSTKISATPGSKRPTIELRRKSKPFWHVLGEHGVFSTILRVPITFPPEKFRGLLLSGMCVPDLRGTQGSFTLYSTEPPAEGAPTGGLRIHVTHAGNSIKTHLPGPTVNDVELRAELAVQVAEDKRSAQLRVAGQRVRLEPGRYSPWVRVEFKNGPLSTISGICRFHLVSVEPEFKLYVTPVNIDPERPALPISHPPSFSIYLAKLLGPFATLGLAEDTWALNESALTEKAFLDQVYEIHGERERMFFEALKKTKRGLCACVFDASDRIQHMFPRTERDQKSEVSGQHPLDAMYERMDELVGRVVKQLGKKDVMMVVSDHGFTVFERGVNLNAWLKNSGYLVLKPGAADPGYLRNVDWEKTRAYTFGLSGIYLNRKGREAKGIVDDAEARSLKSELVSRLRGLRDERRGRVAIREVYDASDVYRGPYAGNGPDLIVGYERGYRASWDAAIGNTGGELFTDNPKHWSGDHCVDYKLVPGVLFCNRKMVFDETPRLIDIAPTVLELFGVSKPAYMDGKCLMTKSE
jgi:predicted AlkP superfamily phosphohydrolase/phosphomutase